MTFQAFKSFEYELALDLRIKSFTMTLMDEFSELRIKKILAVIFGFVENSNNYLHGRVSARPLPKAFRRHSLSCSSFHFKVFYDARLSRSYAGMLNLRATTPELIFQLTRRPLCLSRNILNKKVC